jgi:hypothetical protein
MDGQEVFEEGKKKIAALLKKLPERFGLCAKRIVPLAPDIDSL